MATLITKGYLENNFGRADLAILLHLLKARDEGKAPIPTNVIAAELGLSRLDASSRLSALRIKKGVLDSYKLDDPSTLQRGYKLRAHVREGELIERRKYRKRTGVGIMQKPVPQEQDNVAARNAVLVNQLVARLRVTADLLEEGSISLTAAHKMLTKKQAL